MKVVWAVNQNDGDGGLGVLFLLIIGIVLAPLVALTVFTTVPLLVALHRRAKQDFVFNEFLLPMIAAGAAYWALRSLLIYWFGVDDILFADTPLAGRGRRGDSDLLWYAGNLRYCGIALLAAIVIGGTFLAKFTGKTFRQAVIESAIALSLCLGAFEVFLLVASTIGTPIREISFFGWIMFACYCGLVVALLTGLVLGIIANFVRDGTFRETLQWAMLGTFISSLFTAGIFYFFQLGDRFIDATMGPQGQSSGFAGGLPGYVLLVIPGLLFCLYWLAFAWADVLATPRARLLASLVLGGVGSFATLAATSGLAAAFIASPIF